MPNSHTDIARETFSIEHWAEGYFDVSPDGRVSVSPRPGSDHEPIDLRELVDRIRASGLSLPVLVRFVDILRDRVDAICRAFERARAREDYRGGYTSVYPIKVNQQRAVVEEIVRHGGDRVGLEAGSKPELMAVLGIAPAGGTIVCNGYKDREYLRLAMIGQTLGHRVLLIVEKPSELALALDEADRLGIRPVLGFRVRLASIGAGKWQNTGGEKSKFGLSAIQLLEAVETLRNRDMLDCLRVLHFHLGSQIANIRDIQRGMSEAARYYAETRAMGAPVDTVDVGGGLGVDYEGTGSRSFCSMNYGLDQYAHAIVRAFWEIATEHDLPHPDIITESGRALTAHHSVLITDVIDVERVPDDDVEKPPDGAPLILADLWRAADQSASGNPLEVYQDAVHWIGEARGMYVHGVIDLAQLAAAERLYHAACRRITPRLDPTNRSHHDALDDLNEKLATRLFCNLSIFQSLPDVWAIDQVFPIMPLQHLDEPLDARGVVRDLTCDSDGRVDLYVDRQGLETTLPIHSRHVGNDYYLGVFMTGAYQEILGDMHNLFGDTNSINVELTGDGFEMFGAEHGDTTDQLLRYVHFDPEELEQRYRDKIEASGLPAASRDVYLSALRDGLAGYTYLEHGRPDGDRRENDVEKKR